MPYQPSKQASKGWPGVRSTFWVSSLAKAWEASRLALPSVYFISGFKGFPNVHYLAEQLILGGFNQSTKSKKKNSRLPLSSHLGLCGRYNPLSSLITLLYSITYVKRILKSNLKSSGDAIKAENLQNAANAMCRKKETSWNWALNRKRINENHMKWLLEYEL